VSISLEDPVWAKRHLPGGGVVVARGRYAYVQTSAPKRLLGQNVELVTVEEAVLAIKAAAIEASRHFTFGDGGEFECSRVSRLDIARNFLGCANPSDLLHAVASRPQRRDW